MKIKLLFASTYGDASENIGPVCPLKVIYGSKEDAVSASKYANYFNDHNLIVQSSLIVAIASIAYTKWIPLMQSICERSENRYSMLN